MKPRAIKRVSSCPQCAGAVDELNGSVHCYACGRQFSVVQGIPVFADAPVHTTDSLSEREVSLLLEQVEARGWTNGLRTVLLQLDAPRAQDGYAELGDSRGLLGAMVAGGPHHASVLCLGCTAGAVPFALAERFGRITVCDLSLGRLRVLQSRSTQEGRANLEFVCGGDTPCLPFPAGEFDLVLVDAMALPDVRLAAPAFWCEVARVLRGNGCCFVSALNGHDPRRLLGRVEGYSGIGFLTPRYLRRMLGKTKLNCLGAYGLLPDSRTPQVLFDLSSGRLSRTIEAAPRMRERLKSSCLHNSFFAPAFALAAAAGQRKANTWNCNGRPSFLEGILCAVQEKLRVAAPPDVTLVPQRVTIRRSGRLVILARFEGEDLSSVVIKVPCLSWGAQREQRNADALQLLHASDAVPREFKRLVPRHLASGSFGGQTYFVEDALDGIEQVAADTGVHAAFKLPLIGCRRPRSSIARHFADALLSLHKATAHTVTFGDREFSAVGNALAEVRTTTERTEQRYVWNTIERFLERELLGQRLPLVWSHGDAGCNFLQGRNGELSGIIDWETFHPNGLPLLDWILLCVFHRARHGHDAGWAQLRRALNGEQNVFFAGLPFEDYLTSLNLDRQLIPALALSAWVQYVANRLPERGCDPAWLRRTVFDVLGLCGQLLGPTRANRHLESRRTTFVHGAPTDRLKSPSTRRGRP